MEPAIAAIATGPAKAAIGIIRLSGEGAIQAVSKVFRPADGTPFGTGSPQKLTLGTLFDQNGAPIDQAMATWSKAPHSYTGEDAAELHCHGGIPLLTLALEALFAQGVRQAGPGEFTRRAFLNGKLDLLQAESVADLIDAQTPAAVRGAANRLGGALSRRTEEIYSGLLDLLAHFHAVLDYPDEDLDPFRTETIQNSLKTAQNQLQALLDSYARGRAVTSGVPTAIVGPPNAGKSSLLNSLVGYDRAIVTDLPGTTRDTVDAPCLLGDTLLRLTDTAGLRETSDQVEQFGIHRARAAMEDAEMIWVVLDSSLPPTGEDWKLVEDSAKLAPTLLVWNKCDLKKCFTDVSQNSTDVEKCFTDVSQSSTDAEKCFTDVSQSSTGVEKCFTDVSRPREEVIEVAVSALTGEGLDHLEGAVRTLLPHLSDPSGSPCLTNLRQVECARKALADIASAQKALEDGMPADAVLMEVEEALSALGSLTGRNLQEDTVDRIFSRFCVGK